MFRNINEITFKISPYCNLKCEYCFQQSHVKEDKRIFSLYDDMVKFLRKLPLNGVLEFKVTGGESSLFCDEIEYAYKKLKKIERYKDTSIIFTTITNGTNLQGILNLMDKGILDYSGCKLSWDGIYSSSKSRKPKNKIYDDKFFNNNIKLLGSSKYKDNMLVRTAITPNTIDDLSESLKFLLENGCTKWEYYFLTDCDEYRSDEFISKFEDQLNKIYELYNQYRFNWYNYDYILFTEYSLKGKDKLRSISCRHLGKSLYIDMDGNIAPCGFFSSDCMFEGCKLYIGNIYNGFYKDKLNNFINEYKAAPMCNFNDCQNFHCFECPATNKHRTQYMNNKLCQTCQLRTIEKNMFLKNETKSNSNLSKIFNYSNNWDIIYSLYDELPFK